MPASHEAIGREIYLAGLQPLYEQIACTGMAEAPGNLAA